MAKAFSNTTVKVPCRISFAHLLEPNKEGAYSTALLIPKTDTKTLDAINKAIDAAIENGKAQLGNKDGKVNKKMLKLPLRDADEEGNTNEGYEGMMFFNAKNKNRRPIVVNNRLELIDDRDEIYSGCYCYVIVDFFAFNREGNKGITASLGNVQKIRNGQRLGYGGRSVEDDFEVLPDEDEDFGF